MWLLLILFPNKQGGGFKAPEGYAVIIPPKARMVFQFHYHNHYHDKELLVRDVMNIEFVEANTQTKPMAPFLSATVDFKIPAKSVHTVQYECSPKKDLDLYMGAGHMHEHAKNVLIEFGSNGSYQEIIRADNIKPEEAASAGIRIWPTANPLKLKATDNLRVTCTWENLETKDLTYPEEMCGTFFFHLSGATPLVCGGSSKVKK